MCKNSRLLTLNVVASHELQHLINGDDGEGKLQYHEPLFCAQMGQLEDHLGGKRVGVIRAAGKLQRKATTTKTTRHKGQYFNIIHKTAWFTHTALKSNSRERRWLTYRQRVNIDDHEVQGHGEGHGGKQPEVAPWGHAYQRLVLRQAWKRKKKGLMHGY